MDIVLHVPSRPDTIEAPGFNSGASARACAGRVTDSVARSCYHRFGEATIFKPSGQFQNL